MEVERVKCNLIGTDIHVLVGRVYNALKGAGQSEKAKEFIERSWKYQTRDSALALMREYVDESS